MNDQLQGRLPIAMAVAGLSIAAAILVSEFASPAGQYQMISHGSSVYVLDTGSGEMWHRFHIGSHSSPTGEGWMEVEEAWTK